MKKTILLIFLLVFGLIQSQNCINSTFNSSTASTPNSGFVEVIATNQETNEYTVVSGLTIGHNYKFASTRSDGSINDYITITQSDNTPILSGSSPLDIPNLQFTSIRIHIRLDASCNTDSSFHTVTIENLTNAYLACYKPSVEASDVTYKSDVRIDFRWSAPNMSTPEGYDWEIGLSGFSVGTGNEVVKGSTSALTTNASSGDVLTSSTAYQLYIRSDCGSGNTSEWLGPLTFTTNNISPPENDYCSGAINVLEQTGTANAGSATATFSNLNGGAGTDVEAEICNGSIGNARDDMWFSFIAQTSNVNITVEPTSGVNFIATLYAGNCNSLIYLGCSDDNNTSPASEEINQSGLTIGQKYYVRVYYYNTFINVDRSFGLKIWSTTSTTDVDGDGYSNDPDVDCDDFENTVYPGAPEICDGLDNDCDGQVDEGLTSTFYLDADSDGFGDPNVTVQACSAPTGYVSNNTDCNDNDAEVNPDADEILDNGKDDDCDSSTLDSSEDTDDDGDGETENEGDCDDTNPLINTSAVEICDGIDNDCDGQIDEGVTTTFYADTDNDGFGNPSVMVQSCSAPFGYVSDNTDCDDILNTVYPGAIEICDGIDNDCDGQIDEGVTTTFYADTDNDGYGDASSTIQACSAPAGYVIDDSDCDDTRNTIYPGAPEICDGLDNDCDGLVDGDDGDIVGQEIWYADIDSDGFGDAGSTITACSAPTGYVGNNTDCDDTRNNVYPGALEICDGLDNDCDGQVDEGATTTYYADGDGDGFGDPNETIQSCSALLGYVSDNTDCDDTLDTVYPGATEVCDGIDNDCDGQIDEDVTITFYADTDNDGYGDPNVSIQDCSAPIGYVSDNTDCNDSDSDINPGATEISGNGVDDDCNPSTDDTLDVEEFSLETIVIRPNPFNTELLINTPRNTFFDEFNISMYNLLGEKILFKQYNSTLDIIKIENLENLQQGVYILKISTKKSNKELLKRVVKF